MPTQQELQTALANAQAAGDQQAVQVIQQALQAQPPAMDPEMLSSAYYKAQAAGDEQAKSEIFKAIAGQGARLRGPNAQELAIIKASPDAANGLGSNAQNALAGAGKSVVDNYHGIEQLSTGLGSLLPSFLGGDYYSKQYDQLKQQQAQENQRDAPLMETKSGIAGNILGQIGQAVVGGAGLRTAGVAGGAGGYGATAASGVGQGILQPITSQDGEAKRLQNGAVGGLFGVLGQGAVNGIGQIVKRGIPSLAGKLLPKASPEIASLADRAINDYGIPLKASQVSPSRFAKVLDSTTAKVPFSGAKDFSEAQQKAFNRAVASTIGESTDSITPAVYAQAKKRIGSVYDDITSRNQVNITPDIKKNLDDLLHEANATGNSDSVKAVESLLGRIDKQAPQGILPGEAYQSIQSQLGSIAKSGGEKGNYAGQIKGILSAALDKSISPQDQAAWQLANKQYGALKTIRDLVTKDQVNGNVSPAGLLGRVTANGAKKEAVASGRGGDLAELAAIGQAFLKDGVQNSGTPERLAAYGVLGGAGYAHLPAAVLSVGSARLIQSALRSPKALNEVLNSPQVSQAIKDELIRRLSSTSGLLGQQAALGYQRQNAAAQGQPQTLLQVQP